MTQRHTRTDHITPRYVKLWEVQNLSGQAIRNQFSLHHVYLYLRAHTHTLLNILHTYTRTKSAACFFCFFFQTYTPSPSLLCSMLLCSSGIDLCFFLISFVCECVCVLLTYRNNSAPRLAPSHTHTHSHTTLQNCAHQQQIASKRRVIQHDETL